MAEDILAVLGSSKWTSIARRGTEMAPQAVVMGRVRGQIEGKDANNSLRVHRQAVPWPIWSDVGIATLAFLLFVFICM